VRQSPSAMRFQMKAATARADELLPRTGGGALTVEQAFGVPSADKDLDSGLDPNAVVQTVSTRVPGGEVTDTSAFLPAAGGRAGAASRMAAFNRAANEREAIASASPEAAATRERARIAALVAQANPGNRGLAQAAARAQALAVPLVERTPSVIPASGVGGRAAAAERMRTGNFLPQDSTPAATPMNRGQAAAQRLLKAASATSMRTPPFVAPNRGQAAAAAADIFRQSFPTSGLPTVYTSDLDAGLPAGGFVPNVSTRVPQNRAEAAMLAAQAFPRSSGGLPAAPNSRAAIAAALASDVFRQTPPQGATVYTSDLDAGLPPGYQAPTVYTEDLPIVYTGDMPTVSTQGAPSQEDYLLQLLFQSGMYQPYR